MRQFKHIHGIIDYCIEDYDNSILYLDYLESTIKGSGYGKIIMSDFLTLVKSIQGISKVNLIACESYGVPIEKLERFYNSFGFNALERSKFGVTMELIL